MIDEPDPDRSVDRLIVFTDAVVAIAITLLVLPLAELFAEAPTDHSNAALAARLTGHLGQIGAFLLSFVIIACMWWAHHQVTRRVREWTSGLVALDLAWVLTIVVVPVTTAIIPGYEVWPLSFGLYAGALLLSGLTLTGVAAIVHLDERTGARRGAGTRNGLIGIGVTTASFALALIVGLALPPVHFFALWIIAFSGFVERPLKRRLSTRAARAV